MSNAAPKIPTPLMSLSQKYEGIAEAVDMISAKQKRIESIIGLQVDKSGGSGHPPGMDDAWRTKVDGRLDGLEKSVEGLKGSLDGLKIAASVLAAMVALVGGIVYFTAGSLSTRMDRVEAKVDAIVPRITDEFRAMRAEQSAQTSAIANAITATKQQAPQVILVPAPQVQQPAAPQQ